MKSLWKVSMFFLFLCSGVLSGFTCGPTIKDCAEDADCGASGKCVLLTCRKQDYCASDADCSAPRKCVANQCTSPLEPCKKDTDCKNQRICQNGKCEEPVQCKTGADCGGPTCSQVGNDCSLVVGRTCDSQTGKCMQAIGASLVQNATCQKDRCVSNSQSCSSNSDCGTNEVCKKAKGQCGAKGTCTPKKVNATCDNGYAPVCSCDGKTYGNECSATNGANVNIEHDGVCLGGKCDVSAGGNCGPNAECKNGICQKKGAKSCLSDINCEADEVCVSGSCEKKQSCIATKPCPQGYSCKGGVCEKASSCKEPSDCKRGEGCVNGSCGDCEKDSHCPDIPESCTQMGNDCAQSSGGGGTCLMGVCTEPAGTFLVEDAQCVGSKCVKNP